jgi:hypothetical protein
MAEDAVENPGGTFTPSQPPPPAPGTAAAGTSAVTNSILDGIPTAAPEERQPTTNDIFNFIPEMSDMEKKMYSQMDQFQHRPQTGALPESTYFPTENININKGSYNGSTVGSIPIFAPSALMPYGLFDARAKAVQDAAMMKAKSLQDFRDKFQAPQTKHTTIQPKLDEQYYEDLQKWTTNAQRLYGDNWVNALENDQSFQHWNHSMNTIKNQEDDLVNYVAGVEAKEKEEGFVLSPQTKKAIADFKQGITGLSNPFDTSGHQVNQRLFRMRAEDNLDTVVNKSVDKLTQDVKEENPGITNQGIYDMLISKKTTGTSEDKISNLAKSIMHTHYEGGDSMFSEEDVKNRLRDVLGTKVERTVKLEKNQFEKQDGHNEKYTNDDFSKETEPINVNVSQTGGGVRAGTVPTTDGITFRKEIKAIVPSGAKMIDPTTGSLASSGSAGSNEVSLGKAFIAPTLTGLTGQYAHLNGSIVDQKNLDDPKFKGHVTYEPMVAGTYKTKEDGVEMQKSTMIPMRNVENSLVGEWNKDHTVKKGIPVDEFYRRAAAKNSALSGKPKTRIQNGFTYTLNPATGNYE